MSGYEMRQMMERSTANFWTESYGQIYPALKRMVKDGLATVEEQQKDGRTKKVYKITGEGGRRLRAWLGVESRPQVRRNELLLKVFFGAQVVPAVVREHVEVLCGEAELEKFEATVLRMEMEHARHPAMPYWRMAARCGILHAKATIAWCDETFAELEKRGLVSKATFY